MSTCRHHLHASKSGRVDPSGTYTLREREFIPALRKRFRWLRGEIRDKVGYDQDHFDLRAREHVTAADNYEFPINPDERDEFNQWLARKINEGVLERTAPGNVKEGVHYTAPFIRSAADRGWKDAAVRLRKEDVDVTEEELESMFGLGVAKKQLRKLYSRVYTNLKKITDDMQDAIRDALTQGLAEGVNPRVMAKRLTSEIGPESMPLARARRLARTEVLHSYNEAAILRYRRNEITEVGVLAEWLTAKDNRVCERCASKEGEEYSLDEASGKLPLHPNCRCCWVPVT